MARGEVGVGNAGRGVDGGGEERGEGLADGAAVDAADEAEGVVVGDAVFDEALGEDLRGEGEAAAKPPRKRGSNSMMSAGMAGYSSCARRSKRIERVRETPFSGMVTP